LLFSDQLRILEEAFSHSIYPGAEERQHLVKITGLPEARIQVWFSNRRAKARRVQQDNQQRKSQTVPSTEKKSNSSGITFKPYE
jgi:hypothetical protein